MPDPRPVVLCDPQPRTLDLIFTADDRVELARLADLVVPEGDGALPDAVVDAALPRADIVIGQTDLPAERLTQAPRLKAVFNVEGNFLPNIDYDTCFRRGIHVLSVSPVFALPVAEIALGMALSLARNIHGADCDFRAGREVFGLESNRNAEMLTGAPVGIIGYGDLAKAFRPLLQPFGCPVRAYDPWLPDHVLRAHGCQPASLDEVLSTSRFVFVFATVTADNQGFLGAREFALMPPGASLLLLSRAAVVDFPAMVEAVAQGRIRVATDVFPEEPPAADDPVRGLEGMLLSAHRAGALDSVFKKMGELVLGDLKLVLAGLPPVGCKRAERETVARLRSKAVDKS